ncbi:MAG: hypothetical protein QOI61_2242, partial [Actinomycetota bacterium]
MSTTMRRRTVGRPFTGRPSTRGGPRVEAWRRRVPLLPALVFMILLTQIP